MPRTQSERRLKKQHEGYREICKTIIPASIPIGSKEEPIKEKEIKEDK